MRKTRRCLYLYSVVIFMIALLWTLKIDSDAKGDDDKRFVKVEHNVSEDGGFISDEYGIKFKTNVRQKKGFLMDNQYPDKYDLRNVDGKSYVTSVKDQNPYGSCWTFGTLASAESGLLKKVDEAYDLSEYHLAYYTYHDKTGMAGLSDDKLTVSDGTADDWFLDIGGNYDMSANTLASWCGAVDETVAPYPSNGVLPTGLKTSEDNMFVLSDMYLTDSSPENMNNVKDFIMKYGAVGACIYFDPSLYYVNGTDGVPDCYCYIETAEEDKYKKHSNHAVNIVGWDDDFSKENFKEGSRPEADGAWLVRNSWGEGYKDYFYISYYDSLVSNENVYTYVMEDGCQDDNIYQYDGISITELYYPVDSGCSICNVYTARDDELLDAISTNLMNSNVKYEIQIYVNPVDDNPLSGTPMLDKAQTGTISYAGIKKIYLTNPVRLYKGDRFAVVIKLTDGDGEDYVWASTCCDGSISSETTELTYDNAAEDGESYELLTLDNSLDTISNYNDVGYFDIRNFLYDDETDSYNDLCYRLKAFTKDLKDIEDEAISVEFEDSTVDGNIFTGEEIEPKLVITDGNYTLAEAKDYKLSYENNINAGTATVTATGVGTKYKGSVSKTFIIKPTDISIAEVEKIEPYTYTGKEITPKPVLKYNGKVLEEGEEGDYIIEKYINNVNAGTATIHIKGINNFENVKDIEFAIKPADVNTATDYITLNGHYEYSGEFPNVEFSLKLNEKNLDSGTDYTYEFESNSPNVGRYGIKITGINNFTGEKTIYYDICLSGISSADVEEIEPYTYTGKEITPKPVLKYNGKVLEEGEEGDYIIEEYINNVNAGIATIHIKGINNFNGKIEREFEIKPIDVAGGTYGKIKSVIYNSKAQKPKVNVTVGGKVLTKGTDYKISYSKNVNAGKAKVTITGIGNYSGTKTLTFTINKKSISAAKVNKIKTQKFKKKGVKPLPVVKCNGKKLKKGKDYTLSYKNNKKKGKATIVIIGKGNFKGTKKVTFKIK